MTVRSALIPATVIARLGCPLDNRYESEALVSSFAEAEEWFRRAGDIPLPPESHSKVSAVDELFRAGLPATALWVYDGMFQATFTDPSDTSAGRDWIDAHSWAELEEKMRIEARRRFPKGGRFGNRE